MRKVTMLVVRMEIEFKIDTGSQVNIIPNKDYQKLSPNPKLIKTGVTLSAAADPG